MALDMPEAFGSKLFNGGVERRPLGKDSKGRPAPRAPAITVASLLSGTAHPLLSDPLARAFVPSAGLLPVRSKALQIRHLIFVDDVGPHYLVSNSARFGFHDNLQRVI